MKDNYEKISKTILEGLEKYKGLYLSEYYSELEYCITNLKDRIHKSREEGRTLKIGVVGEVKAGKSSFLNALIFDSNEVLPKAATPMTAALTKITYASTRSAKIVFYTQKEWESIMSLAREYDSEVDKKYEEYRKRLIKIKEKKGNKNTVEIKSRDEFEKTLQRDSSNKLVACKELSDMFNDSLYQYLGTEKEIELNETSNLSDYIGAFGQYTAIVKHVELKENNRDLEFIEIVDTPGMNDPVISRGETTRKFLSECDVIFLLSYTGQFLTQEDINFINRTLPNEGIKNVVIVGSKFDSGILDDNKSKTIKEAVFSSKKIYDKQALDNIEKALLNSSNKETLHRIKDALPPSYISSLLYSCAVKKVKNSPLNANEQHIIDQLKNRFIDFKDDKMVCLKLSGIYDLKNEKIEKIKSSKQEIIEERNKELLDINKKRMLQTLGDIQIQIESNKNDLLKYDKYELEERLNILTSKMNSLRSELRNQFQLASIDVKKYIHQIKSVIALEKQNYNGLEVEKKTSQSHSTIRTGFLGLNKQHITDYTTTYEASVVDVINNLEKYVDRSKVFINEEFDKIINVRTLGDKIKTTVRKAFDDSDIDFNEADILMPLEIIIKDLSIPHFNIEIETIKNEVINQFHDSIVTGNDIGKLKLSQSQSLNQVDLEIVKNLDVCYREIDKVLIEQAETFVDKVKSLMIRNIESLKSQINDKENYISQYTELERSLVEYKQLILTMVVN